MAGNSFGQLFRITTFGESHGDCIGVVIDGCPPRLKISKEEIQKELNRRRPGQSKITSPRREQDEIHILSGVFKGQTTGTPILLLVFNKDIRPQDYLRIKETFRPGHADFTYEKKYGIRSWIGGGRSSARETLARVAAGAIAQKFLKEKLGMEFISFVEQIGDIKTHIDYKKINLADVESNIIRCPDQKKAQEMIKLIRKMKSEGDSIGGIIRGIIKNVPIGLGEPVFDKLQADLAKAMLSINAAKGFEFGSGFKGASLKGSQHNDEFIINKDGSIKTKTNNAGGTLGGISNGETIYFRVAFKATSTIRKKQNSINKNKQKVTLETVGRHDPCVLPRAVPIVDAMAALVIMDHFLRYKAQNL